MAYNVQKSFRFPQHPATATTKDPRVSFFTQQCLDLGNVEEQQRLLSVPRASSTIRETSSYMHTLLFGKGFRSRGEGGEV